MKTLIYFLICIGMLCNPINMMYGSAPALQLCADESDAGVEIQSFNLTQVRPGTVQIDWVTSSETNNYFFYLERSNDGINFTTIATVDGAGTSQQSNVYQVIDNNPGQNIVYYKLLGSTFEIIVEDDLEL